MSSSKLGQTLVKIIDNENSTDPKKTTADDTPFEDAKKNSGHNELEDISDLIHLDGVDEEVDVKEEPVLTQPVAPPKKLKKEKIKPTRPKSNGKIIGIFSLIVSVAAVGIASYTAIAIKSEKNNAIASQEKTDEAIGQLNKTTTELSSDLSKTKRNVESVTAQKAQMAEFNKGMGLLKSDISLIKNEMNELKSRLEASDKSIKEQRSQVQAMQEQLETIRHRPVKTPVKSKKARTPISSTRKTYLNSNYLEGASVASIDNWGSKQYVVLREQNGNWIPLKKRDYYKGWMLDQISSNQAVFRKNKQVRKLSVKE